MKITPTELDLDLLHQSSERSTGLHISDLYNSLYADLEPARYGGDGGPNVVKMALGLAWEAHLERCLIAAGLDATRPDPFVTEEGIAFSPDLIIFNSHTRVGEIKATWMSETGALDDPKFSKWITQAKAYCHHLGVPNVRFFVLFINGSYDRKAKDGMSPLFRVYDIDFTARELQENWLCLVNHGKHKGLL